MYGVGSRGWALAFSAAVLAHAGIAGFVLPQQPEAKVLPDARRVAVFLGRSNSAGSGSSAEVAGSLDAEMVSAVEGAAEVPPREAIPALPETATPPLPEDGVALAALDADTRPPSEEATSMPPESATPPSPEDAEILAAGEEPERRPPREATSILPEPAPPSSPESAETLAALDADTRPPAEEATSTPPEPATPVPLEDAVVLAAIEAGRLPPRDAASILPEPSKPAFPENAVALAAFDVDGAPPPEPETAPALVPEPADTSARDFVAESVRLVEAGIIVSARAPPEPVPVEMVGSAEVAMLSVDAQELAAEVPNMDETGEASSPQEVVQTLPVPATLPNPEEAVALAAVEVQWRPPPEDSAPTPPEPASPPPPEDAGVLTAIEAAGRPPPEEAVSILSEPVTPPPLENAEVLAPVEALGLAPVEETVSTLLEPPTTPSIDPVLTDTSANDGVAEPVRLVATESVVSAAAPEPVEIVDSTELATPSMDSQELAPDVPDVDEAVSDVPLPEVALTPPAPAPSAPLEEAEALVAVETAGSPDLEEVAPTAPASTETVGPAEEVVMRAVLDPKALASVPQSPVVQETERTPGVDEGTGVLPGTADDGGISDERAGYAARLKDWLTKRLRYPDAARALRLTGTASLYVVVDGFGRVLDSDLRASSGHGLLDREVLEMLARAQPLPALPDKLGQERLELIVNIEFVTK